MESRKAKNWYRWLWFSPLLTIPTFVFIAYEVDPGFELFCDSWRSCDWTIAYRVSFLSGVIVSALWHLVLLIPAMDKESAFVRWHGRQALLLAGLRTLVPLLAALPGDEDFILYAIPALIIIWLAGGIWGQRQAKRGDCWLMRKLGLEDELTKVEVFDETIPKTSEAIRRKELSSFDEIALEEVPFLTLSEEKRLCDEDLIKIVRFSSRQEDRLRAINELRVRKRAFSTFVQTLETEESEDDELEIESLIQTVRFSSDRELAKEAVHKLKTLGKVSPL